MFSTLDAAGKQLDDMYDGAQKEFQATRDRLSKEVDERKAEIESAKQRVEAAKKERVETLAVLGELEPGRELETFVQERAASEDYRKLLGVVALIRRDFKRLSDMLRDQDNVDLRKAVTEILQKDVEQRVSVGGAVPEIAESAIDEKLKDYRIDRIVLYIDDLDRCPPKQVVDVLQAIHLLLAFELFVVVVGVDARWIGHALRKQFPEMLNEDWEERNGDGNGERHLAKTATPRDYVEKIFQVPFWLKPLDDDGARKLLEGLIPDSQLLPESGTGHVADVENKTEGTGHSNAQPSLKENASVSQQPSMTGRDVDISPEKIAGDSATLKADTASSVEVGSHKQPDLVLKPENLLLDVKEREAMVALARVIGRTPRTLKRFVNIYRIIKAGLDDEQLEAFMGTATSDAQFRAVLLLLSVAHGAPDLAPTFFRELKRYDLRNPDQLPVTGLKAFLEVISTGQNVHRSLHKSWGELAEELIEVTGKDKDDIPLTVLREWLPVVVRYTFQLGRLSEEVATDTDDTEGRGE